MRRFARTDMNQETIVAALRGAGASVQSLAAIGDGCPDLLVGYSGDNFIVECKNPDMPPSKRKLTPDQERWQRNWMGIVNVVETAEQALRLIGRIK